MFEELPLANSQKDSISFQRSYIVVDFQGAKRSEHLDRNISDANPAEREREREKERERERERDISFLYFNLRFAK